MVCHSIRLHPNLFHLFATVSATSISSDHSNKLQQMLFGIKPRQLSANLKILMGFVCLLKTILAGIDSAMIPYI